MYLYMYSSLSILYNTYTRLIKLYNSHGAVKVILCRGIRIGFEYKSCSEANHFRSNCYMLFKEKDCVDCKLILLMGLIWVA